MTFGSLFSGIGGIDLGLQRAGLECRWQVENDEFCNRVLAKHWPAVARYGDIRGVTGNELECVDLICGGFPCPPVSVAGKRKGTADERWIWPEFARIVRVVRPCYVLVENVPGLLSANDGGAMAEVLGDLVGIGYDAEWTVLRASDFGASHRRARVFIVAYAKNSNGRRPGETHDPGGRHTKVGRSSRVLAYAARDARDGSQWQDRSGREVRSTRDSVADPGDRLLPQPGRGPQGRDGPGSAGEAVGDASRPGLEVGRCEFAHDAGERPTAERASAALADATCHARSFAHQDEGRQKYCDGSGGFPTFAPGPSDPRWPDLLVRHPELRPALSQAEAESLFCRVVDGPSNRTHRLRALGNAVVPQVAEWIGRQIMALDELVNAETRQT